jgi:heme O synthase-like polyprenyltransferase
VSGESRPAFYALQPGGWRDYLTLLHPPYTLWHLSYVALGAAIAPHMKWGLLGWTTLAFLLAMGVGAHALDELQSRPLQTRIPDRVLITLAAASIGGACAIGAAVAVDSTLWLLAFVAIGAFIVVVYNLELFGGTLHNAFWFAAAWGAFPALTGYFASAERLRADAAAIAVFAFLTSLVQRLLSTPVRLVRRRVTSIDGRLTLNDGSELTVDADLIAGAQETSLQLLAAAMPVLAGALLLARVG